MDRASSKYRSPKYLGYAWLAFAAGITVIYRGLTQSLTIDEAFVYHLFLKHKAAVLFDKYDAAYHVLHTWACWLAVHTLGNSEAVIRLPSMLAGIAFLAAAGALCRRVAGDGWRFAFGTVFLTANPFVADYLSIARGYGAALAFFAWALVAMIDHRPKLAGLMLGLGVACNLTFLVPGAAAAAIYWGFRVAKGEHAAALAGRLSLPFVAAAAPALAVVLWFFRSSHFYYGADDIRTSLLTMIGPSLAYSHPEAPHWVRVAISSVFPFLLAAIIAGGIAAIARRAFPVLLAAGSLVISIAVLLAAHGLLGVKYPWSRSGLYLIWLFPVCYLVLWAWTAGERGWLRWLSPLYGAACLGFAALFLSQFSTAYYFDFRDDAAVRTMMSRLRDLHPSQPACMGGTWTYEPTVNYYRDRYRLSWLEKMKRTEKPQAGCRFFIISVNDRRFLTKLDLRTLWSDPVSGAVLAESGSAGSTVGSQ